MACTLKMQACRGLDLKAGHLAPSSPTPHTCAAAAPCSLRRNSRGVAAIIAHAMAYVLELVVSAVEYLTKFATVMAVRVPACLPVFLCLLPAHFGIWCRHAGWRDARGDVSKKQLCHCAGALICCPCWGRWRPHIGREPPCCKKLKPPVCVSAGYHRRAAGSCRPQRHRPPGT